MSDSAGFDNVNKMEVFLSKFKIALWLPPMVAGVVFLALFSFRNFDIFFTFNANAGLAALIAYSVTFILLLVHAVKATVTTSKGFKGRYVPVDDWEVQIFDRNKSE